jgi:hypothetical protein
MPPRWPSELLRRKRFERGLGIFGHHGQERTGRRVRQHAALFQLRNVDSGMRNALANSSCVIPSRRRSNCGGGLFEPAGDGFDVVGGGGGAQERQRAFGGP